MVHHTWCFVFLLISFTSGPEPKQELPDACVEAKCVMENEWINVDELFDFESLEDSGKCSYNVSGAFDEDWSHMVGGFSAIGASKKIALRHVAAEYYEFCDGATKGCSLKRRFMAAWTSTIYWHQWGDYWIANRYEEGKLLSSMWFVSNNYFPTVVAPLFVLCHLVNIIVLKKMLNDDKMAIMFHLAEVISDMASCLFSMMFPFSLHVFVAYCIQASKAEQLYPYGIYKESGFGHLYYLDRQPAWERLLNGMIGFQAANQLYNLFLIVSRWYCLAHPVKYWMLQDSQKSLITIFLTAFFCLLVGLWPGKPMLREENDWEYASYMYCMTDSGVLRFLIKVKANIVFVLYIIIYMAQIVAGIIFVRRFLLYLRGGNKLQGETEAAAKKRKKAEKDKALLVLGTVVVNWICMFPTLVVAVSEALFTKYQYIKEDKWYSNEWMDFWKAMQIFASGLNSVMNFFTHLVFTNSYRAAFMISVVKPVAKVFKKETAVQPANTG